MLSTNWGEVSESLPDRSDVCSDTVKQRTPCIVWMRVENAVWCLPPCCLRNIVK